MYPPIRAKLGALERTPVPIAGTKQASLDGYTLQWVAEGPHLRRHASELDQLRRRSLINTMSVRPDWRATLLRPSGWAETVLFLRWNGSLQAAVFLREKLVAGIRTGYFQGSSTLGDTLLLCDAGRETHYLAVIANLLLHQDRGFLLLLERPVEVAHDLDLAPGLQQRSTASCLHWRMPLKPTLDATIANFSHRTRRNIRSSLRHVEAAGWRFHPNVNPAEMKLAFHDLAGRCTHPFPLQRTEERLEVAANTEGCFSMGLTDQTGRWLCCLVGRRTSQATEIFWQLNAAGCRHVSLCITMRSLMLREEVRRGSPLVLYIGGTCALSLPSEGRYTAIARPGIRLRLLRSLMRLGLPLGPVLRDLL